MRSIAIGMALLLGAVTTRGAELRSPAVKAQCGSLARVAFSVSAPGSVANLQFELAVDGAELVGVYQTPATPKWIIGRRDEGARTTILMRGGPVDASEALGEVLVRIPPAAGAPVNIRFSEIRAFGDGFGETAADAAITVEVDCESAPLVFRPLAGYTGGRGSLDGVAGHALMKGTRGIVTDGAGNIFVADSENHAIRRVDARGETITLAGRLGVPGHADGGGRSALFQSPRGIAIAPDGSLVVADTGTQTIRRVSASGEVTTIAGKPLEFGTADGSGSDARFCFPSAVAVASDGSIIVADTGYLHEPIYGVEPCGQTIRRIDPQGQVLTIAGRAGSVGLEDGAAGVARFSYPSGVAVAADGAIWIADAGFLYGRSYTGRTIRRLAPNGVVTTIAGRPDAPYLGGTADGTGRDAHFGLPSQIAMEPAGTLLVADGGSIRRVTSGGVVTTIGTIPGATRGVAVSSDGTVYASDLNGVVWKLDSTTEATVVAGSHTAWTDTSPKRDPGTFREPESVAVDRRGNAIVADWDRIVRVTPDGRATVVAPRSGTSPFARLNDVAVSPDGTIWATDLDKSCVWRISEDGTVRQIGGANGWFGWADGGPDEAMFFWPSGIAVAKDGAALVADTNNNVLRRVGLDGVVSTIAGVHGTNGNHDGPAMEAVFNYPIGIDCGPEGEIWITESYGHTVRMVTPEGQVLTIAGAPSVAGNADGRGAAARFSWLGGVSVDARGRAWVSEGSMIRVVERDGSVTTAAGGPGGFAQFDASSYLGVDGGLGSTARFLTPSGLAFAPDGRLFVTDSWARSLSVGVPCYEGALCGKERARAVRR
ncbi:MAG: hypothetical protein WC538_19920 [Thermoanaerobaculia bacterium]